MRRLHRASKIDDHPRGGGLGSLGIQGNHKGHEGHEGHEVFNH